MSRPSRPMNVGSNPAPAMAPELRVGSWRDRRCRTSGSRAATGGLRISRSTRDVAERGARGGLERFDLGAELPRGDARGPEPHRLLQGVIPNFLRVDHRPNARLQVNYDAGRGGINDSADSPGATPDRESARSILMRDPGRTPERFLTLSNRAPAASMTPSRCRDIPVTTLGAGGGADRTRSGHSGLRSRFVSLRPLDCSSPVVSFRSRFAARFFSAVLILLPVYLLPICKIPWRAPARPVASS